MKDLGVTKYFLGVEVARGRDGFLLYQHKYASTLSLMLFY